MLNNNTSLLKHALFKTVITLFSPKLWLLSLTPLLISVVLWGSIAFLCLEPLQIFLNGLLHNLVTPDWFPMWLPDRTVWITLGLLLLLMPIVFISTLGLVNMLGVPVIAKRVAKEYHLNSIDYTLLQTSANTANSIGYSVWVMLVLALSWCLTLPLWLLFGLGIIIQLLTLAWSNAALFSREILVDYAIQEERIALLKKHRSQLFILGLLAGVPMILPSVLWVGGALSIILLPMMLIVSLWIQIMVFLATSVLFCHYLMPCLIQQRELFNQKNESELFVQK